MIEGYTVKRMVTDYPEREARISRCSMLSSEHVLMAMARDEYTDAGSVLRRLWPKDRPPLADELHRLSDALWHIDASARSPGTLRCSSVGDRLYQRAKQLAEQSDGTELTTHHLLLALTEPGSDSGFTATERLLREVGLPARTVYEYCVECCSGDRSLLPKYADPVASTPSAATNRSVLRIKCARSINDAALKTAIVRLQPKIESMLIVELGADISLAIV